jgi:protein SCO1
MRAMILLFAVACSGRADRAPTAIAHTPIGPSIYELPIAGLDVDRGHPTLISMFYGSCPAACPALISTIGRTLDQLPARDVRVLLVSFDPMRDTPDHLAVIAAERHLDARWTLTSAREPDARALAAVLGIRYRAVAGGQFSHTSAIVALDRDGRPIARMDGLGDPSALVAALAN